MKKVKAIAALILVFLLVLATNVMDNNHFAVVKRTLTTVYEDRLVAKDHIYKLSKQLQKKRLALHKAEVEEIQQINATANDSINKIIETYSLTKLTDREAEYLNILQKDLKQLFNKEKQWIDASETMISDEALDAASQHYDGINKVLDTLSEIQLKEGKRQINYSNRAIANSDLMSKIEIAVLIAIGIVIQILIVYKPSRKSE